MARISRLIIYDSDDEDALTKQIEKSLPEGTHNLAVKITVINLTKTSTINKEIQKLLILTNWR